MKTCTRCGEEKALTEFYFDKTNNGYHSRCKLCRVELNAAYNRTDAGRAAQRRKKLKYLYGITQEQYDAMLAAQNGCCAICETDKPNGKSKDFFSVDHDHGCCPGPRSCGKCVRMLLCIRCNNGMGWFEKHAAKVLAYAKREAPESASA